MATRSRGNRSSQPRRPTPLGVICLVVGLSMVLTMPGCGGCRKNPAQAKKTQEELEKELIEQRAKKKKERKPDFEVSRVMTLPREGRAPNDNPEDELFELGPPYKPGHWTATTLAAKTNHFDFPGELELEVTDTRGRPTPLVAVPFRLTSACQAVLPKGQWKFFDSVLFVPPTPRNAVVTCRMRSRSGGRSAFQRNGQLLRRMPSYQYHFIVLARWPDRYTYLRSLDAVKLPTDNFNYGEPVLPYYRVALMPAGQRVALPSQTMSWTSIACMLWDDAEPSVLDPGQQQAMLDWLHWGGQLILSGPDTLDTLRDSFLAPYLPATAGETAKLEPADFAELQVWSSRGKDTEAKPPKQAEPWTGVRFQKHPEAQFLPGSGELLVERQVGRGRIVASAFRLSGRDLTSWQGLDELYNAFLLRRPARVFGELREGLRGLNRIELSRGPSATPGGRLPEPENEPGADTTVETVETAMEVAWAPQADGVQLHRLDAKYVSNLRYFTRDAGVAFSSYAEDVLKASEDPSEMPPPGPGLAAWNDFSPVADAARSALLAAAQIEIPKSDFVVWMVVGYLLVLVPANWCVFRLANRVEWAWVAAPVIAVICTVVVIQQAQLDIGFARSRTEVGVVELHADYPRAHVTRYTALYTSLGTPYDFQFDDPGGLAQPFPSVASPNMFHREGSRELLYRRGAEALLSGFRVDSNATDLIHSEQMIDLAAPLSFVEGSEDSFQLINQTELTLRGAGIIRKGTGDDSQIVQTAWLGDLMPQSRYRGEFGAGPKDLKNVRFWQTQREDATPTQSQPQPGDLSLRQLIDLAQNAADWRPGEVRLVAWLEEPIGGVTMRPAAAQSQHAALVVAHLRPGNGEDPQPDVNTSKNPRKS